MTPVQQNILLVSYGLFKWTIGTFIQIDVMKATLDSLSGPPISIFVSTAISDSRVTSQHTIGSMTLS